MFDILDILSIFWLGVPSSFQLTVKVKDDLFCDKIVTMTDVGSMVEVPVVTFEDVSLLTPRGQYNVELHLQFMQFRGQSNDFKIQYSSLLRIFVLPKYIEPHTFVVLSLEDPICKGRNLYPHIVMQFEIEHDVEINLSLSEEQLSTKYNGNLEAAYKGCIHKVFKTILRGLSGAKITMPGKFRSSVDGYAVQSSLNDKNGLLYPLEHAFFFLPEPSTILIYDQVQILHEERGDDPMLTFRFFDITVRLKSEHEFQFRNIQRSEYINLFNFIKDGDDGKESDEEDEDFVVNMDDGGSPTDVSEEFDSSESGDDNEVTKFGLTFIKPYRKVVKKEAATSKATPAKRKLDSDEDGSRNQNPVRKGPASPKGPLSDFMFFSNSEREICTAA
ncbi:FACT complex subunit SSRP1 [Acorus gramineus]|uniref:FACT complex subunit SSRP1 n=1 Tax=Acorus gramineus TaxID=55184 RepID=A0AAV9A757_ACOGR|nr:FACT complex subunit SSRP1 [Acorus gramineus]